MYEMKAVRSGVSPLSDAARERLTRAQSSLRRLVVSPTAAAELAAMMSEETAS
jgi:hypothetical protein